MKFKVLQEDFSKALLTSGKSIFSKASLPVLSNVLITATKNKVEIISTNLETAIKVVVDAVVENEGKATLPGKTLGEFISQIEEEYLTLEKLGEEVLVSSKGNTARFNTMPYEEFPVIPKITNGIEFQFEAMEFINCAKKVTFCAAQDESRPILSGVLVEGENKKIAFVATDGYRLSFCEAKIESSGKVKIVVPAKALLESSNIVSENLDKIADKPITMIVSQNSTQVVFKIGRVEFTSRLIEGEFPAWQKIIPSGFLTKAKFSKTHLSKQIKVSSIFARDAGNVVKLNLEGKRMTISANTNQVGSNESEVEVLEVSGKGGEIAFNYRYLLEVLSVIDDEEVFFEMIESLSPGKFTGSQMNNAFFHIIMPVRLQG